MFNRSVSVCVLVMAVSTSALAGDLNPPAGPVASSMKTLVEVEPRIAINAVNTPGDLSSIFKINQPGSYYLTGNLIGVSAKRGIGVFAADVTIDLNGYSLIGVPGSLDGIGFFSGADRVTIKNGSIVGWDGLGILATFQSGIRVENVRAFSNGSHGIRTGSYASITNCLSELNGGIGIITQSGANIERCTVRSNTSDGINAGGRVVNCVARANLGYGFQINTGSTVSGCTSIKNTAGGYKLLFNIVLRDCDADLNIGPGVLVAGSDNRIESNTCTRNSIGFDVNGGGNFIIRNSASGNTRNYTVVSGNIGFYVIGTTTGAVSGSSGGTTVGTTSPWANFSF